MPKRGGQTRVVVPELTTAVDAAAHTPADAPPPGTLPPGSETNPERPESPDDVAGSFASLDLASVNNSAPLEATTSAATAAPKDKCSHCGKQRATLKRCSRCKQTWYCGAACQNAAWKGHRKTCVT
ncbi:hypothetical protein T484DRAFT_1622771, partial [Baffinella frigidus]